MSIQRATVAFTAVLAALVACSIAQPARAQAAQKGVTYTAPGGATLRLLLNEANVGPEVSFGELTFPPNSDSGDHKHGAIEILYVIPARLNTL